MLLLLLVGGCNEINVENRCVHDYRDSSLILIGREKLVDLNFDNFSYKGCCCIVGKDNAMLCDCEKELR